MPSPTPSLPVFGTESPPVATITASASSGAPFARDTRHPPAVGVRSVTRVSMRSCDADRLRVREEAIAHVSRLVRGGEELRRLDLLHEGNAEARFEEGALLGQWPGPHELAQEVGRRVGDEARLVEVRGEDVAAPAAADEDLPAAVARPFEKERLRAGGGGENRRHRSRRAGADHDHTLHLFALAGDDGRNQQATDRVRKCADLITGSMRSRQSRCARAERRVRPHVLIW